MQYERELEEALGSGPAAREVVREGRESGDGRQGEECGGGDGMETMKYGMRGEREESNCC